jgi:hypothetical protein
MEKDRQGDRCGWSDRSRVAGVSLYSDGSGCFLGQAYEASCIVNARRQSNSQLFLYTTKIKRGEHETEESTG